MSDQQERFRQKMRDRNLGNVPVQTYPANSAAASQERVLSKLELHRAAGKPQASFAEAAAPAESKTKPEDKRK